MRVGEVLEVADVIGEAVVVLHDDLRLVAGGVGRLRHSNEAQAVGLELGDLALLLAHRHRHRVANVEILADHLHLGAARAQTLRRRALQNSDFLFELNSKTHIQFT